MNANAVGNDPPPPDEGVMEFTLTPAHIGLIRRTVWVWDDSESGAPVAAPDIPYGEGSMWDHIGHAFGMTPENEGRWSKAQLEEMLRIHTLEMPGVLWIAATHGTIKPGPYDLDLTAMKYALGGDPPNMVFETYDDDNPPIDLRPDRVTFTFTPHHGLLLANAYWRYCHWVEAIGIDSKRPYGNNSFYFVDMAEILGEEWDEENEEALMHRYEKLHAETLLAVMAMTQNATIAPGRFTRPDPYSAWERAR